MGVHASFAVFAFAAGTDTGNEHPVTFFKIAHRISYFFYDPYAFMAEYPALRDFWYIAFENMEVGAADGRFYNLHEDVGRRLQNRFSYFIPRLPARAVIYKSFHIFL
jgi:hypothetical protein